MKIVTDKAVYVQKNDIAFLNQTDLEIPASIFLKIFGNGIVIINDSNRYEFVKFEEKHEIEFLENIDWMIDYNKVKDLSENEMIELGQKIANEKNEIAAKFNSMSEEYRKNNINAVQIQYDLLEFKIYSLRDILWFKQGHIKMKLPEEIENPLIDLAQEKKEVTLEHEESGIKKLIKSIFNR